MCQLLCYWLSAPNSPFYILFETNRDSVQFSSVQSLSRVWLFATPWIAARQASLFITNSQSSLRLTSIESVMPSSHLIFDDPLLLLPSIPPSIRVFSNESTLHMRWPKYSSFSFSIIPSKEIPGLIAFRMGENNSKWSNWQTTNLKNIQATPAAQFQKKKRPPQKNGTKN